MTELVPSQLNSIDHHKSEAIDVDLFEEVNSIEWKQPAKPQATNMLVKEEDQV